MPIVIEEMTGEIVPPPDPEGDRGDDTSRPADEIEVRRQVVRAMAREARHSDRLSDR